MGEILLVAVDISGCAEEVVGHAALLATRLGTEVVLLHVTGTPVGVEPADVVCPDGTCAEAGSLLDDEAEGRLRELADLFRNVGVSTRIEVRHGAPVEAILQCAIHCRAFMVVLGTHGRTGLRRALMGSVAEEVIRHSTVPVVVVRTQDAGGLPGLTPAQRRVRDEMDG
jgi:nucleotide-binding universal stress UspA family protein